MPISVLNRVTFNAPSTVFVAAGVASASAGNADLSASIAPVAGNGTVTVTGTAYDATAGVQAGGQAMLIGASSQGDSTTAFTDLVGRVGPLKLARIYNSGFPSSYLGQSDANFHHTAGRTVCFSFKPTDTQMDALAAGDAATVNTLRTLLSSAAGQGLKVWWCVRHEPENDKSWTSAQLANFRSGWARFADEVHSYGEAGWQTIWIMMGYSWKASSGRTPDNWYPGNAYVDIVGIDAYNEGSLNASQRWDSPGYEGFGEPHAAENLNYPSSYYQGGILDWLVAKGGKPYAIAEYGSITNHNAATPQWCTDAGIAATKPAWIQYHADYHFNVQFRRNTRCMGLMYFDLSGAPGRTWAGDNTETWGLVFDDPLSYNAYATVNQIYGG